MTTQTPDHDRESPSFKIAHRKIENLLKQLKKSASAHPAQHERWHFIW
jgi:hypothetical protein